MLNPRACQHACAKLLNKLLQVLRVLQIMMSNSLLLMELTADGWLCRITPNQSQDPICDDFFIFFWETNHRFANRCGRPRSSHSIAFQVLLYLHVLLDSLIYILNLFAYILYFAYIYIYIYMSRLSDEQPPLGVNIEGNTPVLSTPIV